MVKKIKVLSTLALTAGLLGAAAQAQTTLTFNNWLPPTHFVNTDVLHPWAADIEKATEGRVKIQFTATSLAPPPRQFDMVRQGVADMAFSAHGYTPGRFLTSQGVELPFLANSGESLSVAYWRTYQEHFAKANEYQGVKLLSLHTHAPGDLLTNTRPLTSMDDLRGMKVRINNPGTARIAEVFGAVAVAQPSSKAYELLSKGVVDATFLSVDAVPQFKLTDYIHHQLVVDGGLFNATFFLIMNQSKWDQLSEQDKRIIEEYSGEAYAQRIGRIWDAFQTDAQKELNASGVTVTRIEGEELAKLRAKLSPVEDEWVESVAGLGVDGRAALEMLRREAAAYHQ